MNKPTALSHSSSFYKSSIVMQGSVIDDNAQLDYVILDKDVLIKDGRRLAGYLTYPVYVPKKSHI